MTRYQTIVADPPWEHATGGPRSLQGAQRPEDGGRWRVPYQTMSVAEVARLPVADFAADDAHLYLWTTNRFLREAYQVVEAWGFSYSTLLTWCKAPNGSGFGGAYMVTTEHVLFARRGKLAPLRRCETTWFQFKRPQLRGGGPAHSAKPDGFLDQVEQVSPGPYLEMFARRARFGWDYWGDQSLQTIEMGTTDAA